MSCQVNEYRYPGSAKPRPIPVKVTVIAGQYYYPWCNMNVSSVAASPLGMAGMQISKVTATFSPTPYLSTKEVP
jgi:hypothetical protein